MKTDKVLGQQVHEYLLKKGVETPKTNNGVLTKEEQRDIIASSFHGIMLALGLDMSDDSLFDTPNRVAKMYVDEIFVGLDYDNFPKCTTVENKMRYDEMIIEKEITSMSSCEHHFVTIDGKAKVAYIPKDKVLGLSKINRIVDYFSRRPQIQERLTAQVYHALCFILGTKNVAVSITATHYCVKSRGIKDITSYTTTNKLGGAFKKSRVRAEFMTS